MSLAKLLVLAMISEALWETLKMTWQNGKVSTDRIGAMVVGLIMALTTGMDIMELVGIPMIIPYLGTVLTGLLISRGANFLHDLLSSAGNMSQGTKVMVNSKTTAASDNKSSGINH